MQEVVLKTDRATALFCCAGSPPAAGSRLPLWISRVGTFRRNAGRVQATVMQPLAPADLTPR